MALHGIHHPKGIDEALGLLMQDPEAKVLGGGASLVAMMNARVLQPGALISLKAITDLQGIAPLPDGRLRIGAFTRHRDVAASSLLQGTLSVVRHAAAQIANAAVRNMGTIGGAIAHADPGGDFPPALMAVGAEVEIRSVGGGRILPIRDFFVDWYSTALEPGELVTAVLLPAPQPGRGVYVKQVRVSGDFATASVAVSRRSNGAMRVAVGACGPTPIADDEADRVLSADGSDAAIVRAGELLQAKADPIDDVRGSAEYRRLLIPRLLARAVHEVRHEEESAA